MWTKASSWGFLQQGNCVRFFLGAVRKQEQKEEKKEKGTSLQRLEGLRRAQDPQAKEATGFYLA